MPNAIDNAFRLSLTYPNPSLCQNNNTIEDGRRSDEHPLTKPEETVVAKNTTGRLSQGVLVTSLLSGLLFSSLDTSIAATSLVAISRELQDFGNAPWIVLAYLLTYMGFAIVISKLSDIYGRRNMLVLSWVLFTAFSLGCASSRSMVALIICRGFQGIGASGLYSLTQIGLVEVGPSHRPSLIGAMIGATLTIAFVLGPIIGGVIVQFSDWRWLFNMNIPFGLIAMLAITNFWPPESAAKKLQIVDRQSVLMASVHLLPMLGACATGSFLGGAISSKKNNTAYTIVAAACLQLFGVTLMSIIPSTVRATQYVFQIAFGLGVGLCFSAATIMTNLIAPEQRTRAVAQGAVAQARVLGGCVGISVCTVVFNAHVNGSLRSQLSPEQLAQIHRSPISGLQFPTDKQEYVRSAYSGAFTEETRVMIVNCAVMVAASLFTLERHPPSLEILTSLPKKQQSSNRNGDSTTELDEITRMRQTA
ncbi:putative MFS-type transporter yusP [Beauveria bassiana D1-5]|uniref:Putative MFS-type transporter yusP n=1 Tax=Beauveria bassiana D1-5 TaxID=1245745 RepID=A0A0A2VMG6_BEABA|nr:putative MFS-type transporter yusP [Beauveria bassiana D1-5]